MCSSATSFSGEKHLLCRSFSQALLAAEPHIDFALADAALPRKQTEPREQGTLNRAFAGKPSKLLMATGRAGTHKYLNGCQCSGTQSN